MDNRFHNCRSRAICRRQHKHPASRRSRSRKRLQFERLEARYVLAGDSVVVFNEIMYHPLGDLDATREWIELYNQQTVNNDLSDWALEGGVDFKFANNTVITGRTTLLVVPFDPAAEPQTLADFKAAYKIGASVKIVGPYNGQLANDGEELRLVNNSGRLMDTLNYGDSGDWPAGPDGSGASLVKRDPNTAGDDPANWTSSTLVGGTPGVAASSLTTSAVVINEMAPATDPQFWLELTNTGTSAANLGGMVVHWDGLATAEYTLPATSLQPGGFLTLTEADLGFHPADGDKVFLYKSGKGEVLDAHDVTNRLRGRSPRYGDRWLWPTAATPGSANTFVFQDNVVINEIMYHAYPILATPTTPYAESTEEWIELYNRGTTVVDLSGWTIAGGIKFTFPAGTTLAADSYLVVAKDSAALAAKYPAITIVGNFSGTLSNSGDAIRLADANQNPADETTYYDSGRWPIYADGNGSSLELRNPWADNSKGESWAASDEATKSVWKTYTVAKTSTDPLGISGYNEWIFGLLDKGEFLMDDISLRDLTYPTVELIQNGTFQSDAVGAAPATWRFTGNHSAKVEIDPANAANKVMHVIATDAQQFVDDHFETTFAGNTAILDGHQYKVTFRAKWIAGSSQINNRLYFDRMGNTIAIDVPRNNGTPGARNSCYVANTGPTYVDFGHTPVLPQSGQVVTVYAKAEDPDGVAAMKLYWNLDGGGATTVTMTLGTDGYYRATIPGQGGGAKVQFWVEGRDGLNVTSTYPAAGANARAMYQVNDDQAPSTPVDTFRVVITSADNNTLFTQTNLYSNQDVLGTLIYTSQNVTKAYYNIRLQVTGSRWIRPNSGYKISFGSDQLFLGVQDALRFDMSGAINGAREIFIKQMVNRAGGSSVSNYDDIVYMVTPQHSGRILLMQLARYGGVFLDSQFENGSDGTLWEMDDITYPTNPDPPPEGLKTGTGVSPQDIQDRGTDPEAYPGQLLIKSNRAKNDYSGIVAMAQAMNKSGDALYTATNAVMDVDLWMRHYATQAFVGNWDSYGFNRPKNLRIYQRPSDAKMIPLYWDADLANFTEPLLYYGDLSRLDEIRDIPQNKRLFYGHLLDLVNRSFNATYSSTWINYYAVQGGDIFGDYASRVANREAQVRSEINGGISPVAFAFTNNSGNDFSVNANTVTLTGNGWVDVREIRKAGHAEPLTVTWTGVNTWQVTVPLPSGPNTFSFQAYNPQGTLVGSDTITVTSTVAPTAAQQFLKITEINYNPSPATDAEIAQTFTDQDFEFIELTNISTTQSIDLRGVKFTLGVTFDFNVSSSILDMLPGDQILVVRNKAAFEARYGANLKVAGVYTGGLNNDGEAITLMETTGIPLADFAYSDSGAWPGRADGQGSTLELVSTSGSYANPQNWRSSLEFNGTPGGNTRGADVVVNEVLTHTDQPLVDAIELYNTTASPVNISGWWLSDSNSDFFKFQIPTGTVIDAHGYLTFYQGHWVGNTLTFAANEFGGGAKGFGLNSAHGDDVWLVQDNGAGGVTRFADHAEFGATANGESWGRWQDDQGNWHLVPMRQRTLGAANNTGGNAPRVGPLVITEVMYAPKPYSATSPLSAAESSAGFTSLDQMEYLEIFNPTMSAVDLTHWQLDKGVTYAFAAGTTLAGGRALVIVPFSPANAAMLGAFRTRYGMTASLPVVGPYTGLLSNSGVEVQLLKPDVPPPLEPTYYPLLLEDYVTYSAAWGANADGKSLQRVAMTVWGNSSGNWGAATATPGAVGAPPSTDVVINEILARTGQPLADAIELYNTSAADMNLGGWYLSNSDADYRRFRIPDGTVLAAHSCLVFYQGHWAGNQMEYAANEFGGGPTGFDLNGTHGGDIYLLQADAAGNFARFADHVSFGPTVSGESLGRWQDEQGNWHMYPMRQRTLGAANNTAGNGPRVGPLVITEVMYAPKPYSSTQPLSAAEINHGFTSLDQMEYLEIYNPTASPVDLTRWQVAGAVTYAFAASTTLAARSSVLLVSFDPTNTNMLNDFKATSRYNFDSTKVKVVGPFTGHLSNSGDKIRLIRPDTPPVDEPTFYPSLLEDEVLYMPAWGANGDGKSLSRLSITGWGLNQGTWSASTTSAGASGQVVGRSVFYNNSAFDRTSDDNAIATDKTVLLPGQQATLANYTSYSRGINGVMIDIAGLATTALRSTDFDFKVGNSADLATWTVGPAASITARPAVGGISRVILVWPDNSMLNQWLQVTVKATANTGLAVPDVFYFGNAVGETGNHATGAGANAVVDAADEAAVRSGATVLPASLTNRYDFNRDRKVNATDELIARSNYRQGEYALQLLNLTGVAQAAAETVATAAVAVAQPAVVAEPTAASASTPATAVTPVAPSSTTPAPPSSTGPSATVVKAGPTAARPAAHDAVLATAGRVLPAAAPSWAWLWQTREGALRKTPAQGTALSGILPWMM